MTEKLPNLADTSGSTTPAPPDPLEVTRQDIDTAGFEDVPVAIDSYTSDIHARMDGTTSPTVQKGLEKELERADLAADWSIKWFENNQKRTEAFEDHETFKQFLDRNLDEETHPVVLEQVSKVYDFAHSGAYDKFMGDAIHTRRQGEALEGASSPATEQAEQAPAHDPAAEARQRAEQQQRIDEALDGVEQARGVEVFDDVVKLGKGRTYIHTDVRGRGFTNAGDDKSTHHQMIPNVVDSINGAERDWHKTVNEAVMFTDVTKQDTHRVAKERQVKGRFGRVHTEPYEVTEPVPGSWHPVMVHNPETGQEEPAVRFEYQFKISQEGASSGELPEYQEAMGARVGNQLQVGLDLPKSVADKLKEQVQRDPASVRPLVEKLVLENNNGVISEELWRTGVNKGGRIRPPYEGLPSDWTIAMISDAREAGSSTDEQVERLKVGQ